MIAVALGLVVLGQAVSTAPYARTKVKADDPNSHCLWWQAGSVQYIQSAMGNPIEEPGTPRDSVFAAVTRSWMSWQSIMAQCGNLTLSESATRAPGTTPGSVGRTIGYDQSSSNNINLVLFRQQYCYSPNPVPANDPCVQAGNCNNAYDCMNTSQRGVIALTTTTFLVSSGRILDADIEINAGTDSPGNRYHFTAADGPTCVGGIYTNCISTDVQNTLTHEFGHSLGLDHTTYSGSIMNPSATPGETVKRTIDPNSGVAFVCNDAYPKGKASHDCVAAPAQSGGGCSAVPGEPIALLAGLLALLLSRRLSRRA